MPRFLIATLIATLLTAPAFSQTVPEPPERRITVAGTGDVTAAPDMATITVGVSERAETAVEALQANTRAMQALFDVLDGAGIDGVDRQTSGLSLQPVYDHNNTRPGVGPEIVAYEASNMLTIRVTKLPVLGEVLDGITVAGANRINGIVFGISETEALMDEARRAAMRDAVGRATALVEEAGATLGPVVTISETGQSRPMPMQEMAMMGRAVADQSVPIAEGEVGLTVRVSATFAIE
ncbi:SIMPL domain-containing protein [Roseobacter sp. HKCCA0434]|uniref:SIMPL domain-containing protein n=1 Tax=Roseobacter sp. HKCCA0434 TaxID=3079297 RepID=UPI002905836C|nr:SIMPL domain-containing protein [Roseobacter sp. HKCCA0434]